MQNNNVNVCSVLVEFKMTQINEPSSVFIGGKKDAIGRILRPFKGVMAGACRSVSTLLLITKLLVG